MRVQIAAMTESRRFPIAVRIYAETLAMVAASTGIGLVIAPRWGTSPIDMLYLVPVLAAASLYGLRPGLFAAAASTLAFNFFFTEPVHSLAVHSPADVVTLIMLFAVAAVVSQLAARMRTQARIAAANAARHATIAGFAGRLLSRAGAADIAAGTCRELADLFAANAVMVAPSGPLASAPADAVLTPADTAAAAWVIAHGLTAGRGSPRLGTAEWRFFPVRSGERTLAAFGLARGDGAPPVADEQQPLLDSLLDQTALALERAALEEEMRGVTDLRERDRLRGALLSSVGHDLRTPLTAIVAAAAELRRRAPADDAALAETLEAEAATLSRYIANLLDMTRLEAGAIRLQDEPVDLVDCVSAASRDLARSLAGHALAIDIPADLPLVRADPHLLHHCLINLLDNAARHAGPGSAIAVSAERDGDGVALAVADAGPGLPPGDPFAVFARVAGSDRTGGTGLGLAIVKGFAEAMGIEVAAGNRQDGAGALFTLRFPHALVLEERQGADAEGA